MSFTSRIAAAAARGYGMFAAVARAVDPFFNYVTALLHGDGTNGAQNNTFLDSSTNNFTITRNGNTTQGTFSPFSQTGWSAYFDGSGDYINFTNQATTGSFTCECWFYRGENVGGYNIIFGGSNATSANPNNVQFPVYNDGSVALVLGGSAVVGASGTNVARNQWNHIAWVRSGTSCAIFVNGVRVGTGTSSAALNVDRIGTAGGLGPGTYDALGYISNARITTTAVYDVAQTTCTVPTTPLTAISGTYLLTLQSNRFVDNSASPLTLTVNGNTSVQAFSPFNPTSAWSASSNGGSGYFDGSGDYLTFPNGSAFAFGTGAFTIEGWVNSNALNDAFILSGRAGIGTLHITYGGFGGTTPGCLRYVGSSTITSGTVLISNNAWNHFAVVRDGSNNITLYVNGVSVGTGTDTTNYTATTGTWYINANDSGPTAGGAGYISNLRIVKGTQVYTTAFTPPTAPLTAITNTSFLMSATNAGIYDNAAVADYETVGNAQVSTSVKKYGTGSMAFDGTGDYLSGPTNANFAFGTGDFTVEGWVYFNSVSGTPTIYSSGTYNTSQFTLRVSSSKFQFYGGNGATLLISGSTTLTTGVWYHFAVCRIAGVTKLFVNGNTDVTDSTAFTYSPTGSFSVGETIGNTGQLNGYIDDLRITKGKGRYQYNFTPPTAAFPNIGGTVTPTSDQYFNYTTLLLPGNGTNGAQNNTFLDSSSNAFTITRNGNTTQGNFSPFSQTGWGNYFGGSSDYINFASSSALSFASDFTVEAWVYNNYSTGTFNPAILYDSSSSAISSFEINNGTNYPSVAGITATNTVTRYTFSTGPSVPVLQWVHVAWVRSSGTVKVYVNGTASTSTLANSAATGQIVQVANGRTSGSPWNGYISNLRITSSAVYTSNFTPSSVPLTAISGTQLLTCQANRFVDASSNALSPTLVGSPSVQAFSPFAPTAAWTASTNGGSGYFDGSGDYLRYATNTSSAFSLGTNNFTCEAWVYPTAFSSANIIACQNQTNGSAGLSFALYLNASGQPILLAAASTGVYAVNITGTAIPLNTWTHLAVTRNGSTFTIWKNGTSDATATSTVTITQDTTAGYGGWTVGASTITAQNFTGYIADHRLVNGTAVYTGAFTPPTAPLTAISGTSLLLSATNGGITDATAKNDLETVGNAQISTTQSKFGGSSMYFDGTGDWLYTPSKSITTMGGDFTAEGWVYLSSTAAAWPVFTVGDSSGATGLELYRATSTGKWRVYSSNVSQIESSTSTSTGSWVHLAVVRYSGSVKLYVNGINEGSAWSTSSAFSGAVYVAAEYNTGSVTVSANGYIDDFRITLGIARYTSNFTPPTSAFLLQ